MNKQIKEIWLDRLKSGSYIQAMNKLKKPNKLLGGKGITHCCLGVLCEVYSEMTGLGYWRPSGSDVRDFQTFVTRTDESAYILPKEVIEWADIEDRTLSDIINANDSGYSVEPDYSNVISVIEELPD